MFDAVLFDLDETLLLDEPVSRHAFHITALELTQDEARAKALAEAAEREAKALGHTLPSPVVDYCTRIGHSALEALWATYDARVPAEAQLEREMERLRPETWRRALAAVGLHGDPDALQRRWQALRAQFPLFPDCDALLARLRPHTKLGMVTNGVSGLQRRKVQGSGLAHWFDAIAISGEVGIGKPDPGVFEWVCRELGVSPARCAMVGDNPERDIQGGLNAGMATAWVDRKLKPRGAQATVEAVTLLELLPWLERG
jgi:putative hydrolase of the HAD superfamily